MSIHPTLSDACVQYSVKKYFVEGYHNIDNVPIFFTNIYQNPEDEIDGTRETAWVRFRFDGCQTVNGLRELKLNTYFFSRGTSNKTAEDKLTEIKDLLTPYLVNLDPEGNGIQAIPLFDVDTKVQAASMMVTYQKESAVSTASDKTLYQLLPIRLKWPTI